MHIFSLASVRRAFEPSTMHKVASKFAKYIRTAPVESLQRRVPELISTLPPAYGRAPKQLSAQAAKLPTDPDSVDREELLRGIRGRFRQEAAPRTAAGMARAEAPSELRAAAPTATQKAWKQRGVESPLVRVTHSGTAEGLLGAVRHGPNNIFLSGGVNGRVGREFTGLHTWLDDGSHLGHALDYSNIAMNNTGGTPARMSFDFPQKLLSPGNSDQLVPYGLWSHAKNFKIEPDIGPATQQQIRDPARLAKLRENPIFRMDSHALRPAGIRRMEEDAAAALRNRNG